MAVRYALELLIEAVSAQVLKDWGSPEFVTVVFGQKEPRKNINVGRVGRIVFTDGDDDGDQGEVGDAAQWEHPAPQLYDMGQRFRIFSFAHDPKNPENEAAQFHIATTVLHEVFRAIYRATHNAPPITSPVRIGNPKRIKPEAQHNCGVEFRMVCTIEQPILDAFDGQLEFTNVAPVNANVTTTIESLTDTYQVTTRQP